MQPAGETFYDVLSNALRRPFRRDDEKPDSTLKDEKFWALRDINFDIQPGEVVGVIGRNGAGKSTLLKILSRITAPTRGHVEVRGRLASLLEVGTGFHPELSGRENIFLNGAILGMSRAEVARKFDDIVSFAEVEMFIDTPVKRYSSGMYVRLAFAVAAHLDMDVLVVDEVLAVGDATFQEKCLAKMGDISKGGRTILFVSHNQGAIARLCQTGIVMAQGSLAFRGGVSQALGEYIKAARIVGSGTATVEGPLAKRIRFDRFQINGEEHHDVVSLSPFEDVNLSTELLVVGLVTGLRLRFEIWRQDQLLLGIYDQRQVDDVGPVTMVSSVNLPAQMLSPGEYRINIVAFSDKYGEWLRIRDAGIFVVATDWSESYETGEGMGLINLPLLGTRSIREAP